MSRETLKHLNTNTLIGYTDKRGHAWHYRAEEQGTENNHYPGAIPIEDVRRRLFPWEAIEGAITFAAELEDATVLSGFDPTRKAIVRSDLGTLLEVFKDNYKIHQYQDALLDMVADLLDDGIDIGSAGILQGGGQAWVSVEVPDNIVTPEGVVFRPHLLACSSHNGSLASTYRRCITKVVCDNTMKAANKERGPAIKVRHSKYSSLKLQSAKDALGLIQEIADDFAAEVAALTAVTVTDKDWQKFLESFVPIPEDASKRAESLGTEKREKLSRLYLHDERCAPWKGTAFGVVQTVNTYAHHETTVRNVPRGERNMENTLMGKFDALDLDTTNKILAVVS